MWMFIRANVILLMLLCVIVINISARGCPKRKRETKIGSSLPNVFLSAPSNLIAEAISSSEIRLSWQWQINPGTLSADGFEIERKTWAYGTWEEIATVALDVNSYLDSGPFSLFTAYYYRVRAFNTIDDRSDWSNESMAIVQQNGWSAIVAGESHTHGITTEGNLWSWGSNFYGQLGVGDTINRLTPSLIASDFDWYAFEGIDAIGGGTTHSIARKTDGTLWASGTNGTGQLGIGDTTSIEAFDQIGSDSDWSRIALASFHTLAIKSIGSAQPPPTPPRGTIWGWGDNNYGQLGLGDTIDRYTPSQIGTDSDWSYAASAGYGSYGQTIAIKTNGVAWGWGSNYYGQLGLGISGDGAQRPTPVQIGSDTDWFIVTIGASHSIALKTNLTMWGWGENSIIGQLGLGVVGMRLTPTQIGTESNWAMVDAGNSHNIALKASGTIWSWGWNNFGQLGQGDDGNGGTGTERTTPTQIGINSDWMLVTAGFQHTLAVKNNGVIWGWGRNYAGHLGLGDIYDRNAPCTAGSPIPPSNLIASLVSSSQVNLTWTDRSDNEEGFKIERKDGSTGVWLQLDMVNTNITSYSDAGLIIGTTYSYRVKAYNSVGDSSYSNKVNALPTISVPTFLIAQFLSSSQIDLSWTDNSPEENGFKIERKTGGTGTYEQIGTVGPNITYYSDINPSGFTHNTFYYYRVRGYKVEGDGVYSAETCTFTFGNWATIEDGGTHAVGLDNNYRLWTCGQNSYGQLGFGDTTIRRTFTQLGNDTDWTIIAGGTSHTLAGKINGTIWSWGKNDIGQLGLDDTINKNTPTQVGSDTDWNKITAGGAHTIAGKADGTIWSWGKNDNGQLGLADTISRTTPAKISSETNWTVIAAGSAHTLAGKSDGTIYSWGWNNTGQLGLGDTTTNRNTPTQIGTVSDWSSVIAGYSHSFGIKANGTLWAWGLNSKGQLGEGTTINRITPRQVGTISDWSSVAGGDYHSAGIKSNKTLWTWGENTNGQLGFADTLTRKTPTQVGTDIDWLMIKADAAYTLALKTNKNLWAWGRNNYGQLGFGDAASRNIPSQHGTPSIPYNLSASFISDTQVNLSWSDTSNNELGFRIERKTNVTGTWSEIATVSINVTSYPDSDVNQSNTYYYRIRTFNYFGNSAYSSETDTSIPP